MKLTQKTQFRSLGQEDPLEGKITRWVFLPEKFHGQRTLVGYTLRGLKESDRTEDVHTPSIPLQSQFSSIQLLSHVWIFVTPWTAAHQTSLSITNSQSLHKFMSIESVIPSNHLILCRPLLLLLSIFLSIRVVSNESALCIRWPKNWSFSFNISPCSVYPGLISFRMDWMDLLVFQGTLKSLLQKHQFFCTQLYL